MFFEAILGQAPAIAALDAMIAAGRIPSALLFLGPRHVGKRATALALAKALNCAGGAGCRATCPSCRKIDEAVHPDVEVLVPEGQFIRIQQVRDVIDRLGLVPFEARKRVVVISQAERMHPAAANAFLKTLEEPPSNTLIVLCAPSRARLFDTIVSRCLPVRFGMLPEGTVRELYSAQGIAGEELDFAVRFARGCIRPDLGQRAAQWLEIRDQLIGEMASFEPAAFAGLSERFAKWSATEDWRFVLEWLETWFRDLALLGGGGGVEALINQDRLEALNQWSVRFPPPVALACHRRVLTAWDAIGINAAKPLALEALWLACGQCVRQGQGQAPGGGTPAPGAMQGAATQGRGGRAL